MVMKLSTHSFTLTSPADVARMCSGPSEERSSEVCACEDVDGKIEKPCTRCSYTSALEATILILPAARARFMNLASNTVAKLKFKATKGDGPEMP